MAFFVTIPACNAADNSKPINQVVYKNNIASIALQDIKKLLLNAHDLSHNPMLNLLDHHNLQMNEESKISLTLKEKFDYMSVVLNFYQGEILTPSSQSHDTHHVWLDGKEVELSFHGLYALMLGAIESHPLDKLTRHKINDPIIKSMLRCIFLMGRTLKKLQDKQDISKQGIKTSKDDNISFLERMNTIRGYWREHISDKEEIYKLQEAYLTALILHAAGLKDGLNTHLNEMKEEGFDTSKLKAFIDNDPSGFLITTIIDDEPRPLLATLNEDLKELGPKLIQLKPELFFQ